MPRRWPGIATALGGLLLASPALADDADKPPDPGDLFGFKPRPRPVEAEVADCTAVELRWPCVIRAGAEPDATPAAHRETLTRDRLWRLGRGNATHDLGAAQALGAWLELDGGVAFAGASSLENRWLVDGFPIDSVVDGGGGQTIPLVFLDRIEVVSGGHSVSTPASTGAVIDARLRRGGDHHQVDAYAWSGIDLPRRGSARARGDVPDLFDPLVLDDDLSFAQRAAVTAGGPLPRGPLDRAWYFAGVSPYHTRLRATRSARRLEDADGNARYDRHGDGTLVLDVFDEERRDVTLLDVPLVARVGLGKGAHDLELTAVGSWWSYPRRSADGTVSATSIDRTGMDGAAFASWTSRWARTELRVRTGWARASAAEEPGTSGGGQVQISSIFIPTPDLVPDDAAVATGCDDSAAGDPSPMVANCPMADGFYLRDGAGLLTDTVTDRPTASVEAIHRRGDHRLSIGAAAEDARYVIHRRYTGGELHVDLVADDDPEFIYQLVVLDDSSDTTCTGGVRCRVVDVDTETYRTRHLGAWLEDTWQPVRGLTVQAGLRWESYELGGALTFRTQLAPRLAVAFDPSRRGRGRVFASWGRYHSMLPADLGRALTGDAYIQATAPDFGGSLYQLDGDTAIDPELELPTVDELAIGAERVVVDRLHVGALYRERRLWHGFEDISSQDERTFLTPGRGAGAGLVPMRRDSRELMLWFGNAPDAGLHVRAGWVTSQQRGTWAGPFDADLGAGLYRSSFDGTTGNADGKLPLDLPHRFFAEAIYGGRAAGFDLTFGARFALASGRPRSALGGAGGDVALLPRGSAGRLPTTSTTQLHLGARRGRLELGADLVNLFAHQTPIAVDQRWTVADTRPIEAGEPSDLVWLKDLDGQQVRRNRGYGAPTRYQTPLLARLSVTVTF